jgi:hypothetical protein
METERDRVRDREIYRKKEIASGRKKEYREIQREG